MDNQSEQLTPPAIAQANGHQSGRAADFLVSQIEAKILADWALTNHEWETLSE